MSNIIEKPFIEIKGKITPNIKGYLYTDCASISLDEFAEGLKVFMPKPYVRLPRKKKKMLYKNITIEEIK